MSHKQGQNTPHTTKHRYNFYEKTRNLQNSRNCKVRVHPAAQSTGKAVVQQGQNTPTPQNTGTTSTRKPETYRTQGQSTPAAQSTGKAVVQQGQNTPHMTKHRYNFYEKTRNPQNSRNSKVRVHPARQGHAVTGDTAAAATTVKPSPPSS